MTELLTIQDIAEILRCCTKTAREWIRKEKIPYYRRGNRILISQEDFHKLLKAMRIEVGQ